jgi:hypothetical protein
LELQIFCFLEGDYGILCCRRLSEGLIGIVQVFLPTPRRSVSIVLLLVKQVKWAHLPNSEHLCKNLLFALEIIDAFRKREVAQFQLLELQDESPSVLSVFELQVALLLQLHSELVAAFVDRQGRDFPHTLLQVCIG